MNVHHFNVLLEWDSETKLWVSYVPVLNNLSTYGETKDKAMEMTREAIIGYLEAVDKEGLSISLRDTHAEWIDLEVQLA